MKQNKTKLNNNSILSSSKTEVQFIYFIWKVEEEWKKCHFFIMFEMLKLSVDHINCLLLLLWCTFASYFSDCIKYNIHTTYYKCLCSIKYAVHILFEVWLHERLWFVPISIQFRTCDTHVWRIGCVCGWLRCIHRLLCDEGVLNGNDIGKHPSVCKYSIQNMIPWQVQCHFAS